MKIVLVSSEGVWSVEGVGGSDSLNRRIILGFERLGDKVDKYFARDGLIGCFSFLYRIFFYRRQGYYVIVYRLKPLLRMTSIVGLFGYKRSVVYLPFEPKRFKKITLLSYLLISKKRIVVSENLQELIKKHLNVSTYLVEPPVPHDFIKAPLLDRKEFDVIFIGRVDPRKGFGIVLDLFESLKDKDVKFGFYVVYDKGDSGVLELINRSREIGANLNVIDIKAYSKELDENLMRWLDSAEYFVQPYKSIYSTVDSPLLLYEAASRGLNILTTDIPQTKNIGCDGRVQIDDFVKKATKIVLGKKKIVSNRMRIRDEVQVAKELKKLMTM